MKEALFTLFRSKVPLVNAACSGDNGSSPTGNGGFNESPSCSADIQPIFKASCTIGGYHDSGTEQGGLNVDYLANSILDTSPLSYLS
jgi:hypothetical protein